MVIVFIYTLSQTHYWREKKVRWKLLSHVFSKLDVSMRGKHNMIKIDFIKGFQEQKVI